MSLSVDHRARGLIFDIDGTLVDTHELHRSAWANVFERHGQEMTDEFFRGHFGRTTAEWVESMNDRFDLSLDVAAVRAEKDQAYIRSVPLAKPHTEVVQLVRDNAGSMPIAVGTNEGLGVAMIVLRSLGLAGYFTSIVSVDDVGVAKPDPAVFLECASRLSVSPEECQVFEDSDVGVEAARRAGMIVTDVRPFVTVP